jgi:hypothetical protein
LFRRSTPPQSDRDAILAKHLEDLLNSREYPKTICPSEVARKLSPSELEQYSVQSWRDAMPDIRSLAWKLRESGKLEILQKENPMDPDLSPEDLKGPIRLRRNSKELDLKT